MSFSWRNIFFYTITFEILIKDVITALNWFPGCEKPISKTQKFKLDQSISRVYWYAGHAERSRDVTDPDIVCVIDQENHLVS